MSSRLARQIVLDEMFDLTLYRRLRIQAKPNTAHLLQQLIRVEEKHVDFWQTFFHLRSPRLNPARRFKLACLSGIVRLFGEPAIHLIVEAIEIYGVRKYLTLWSSNQDRAFQQAVSRILRDELEHEDALVSASIERKISATSIRDIFFGFNDGSVEILGAVSGFSAAFAHPTAVTVAGLTVAVAGALSMGAGAYMAASSEAEVKRLEDKKRAFSAGEHPPTTNAGASTAFSGGCTVGFSYFVGALLPVLPFALGHMSVWPSVVISGSLILLVSYVLAFLSGMNIRRRMRNNLLIVSATVLITYLIGRMTHSLLGVQV